MISFRSKQTETYQLGFGEIFLILALFPLLFLVVGAGAGGLPLSVGVKAIAVLLVGFLSAFARGRVDLRYQISPRPLVSNPLFQAILGLVAFVLVGLSQWVFVTQEISLLNLDISSDLAILFSAGIVETVFIQYLVFTSLWIAGILAFKNYYFSALIALILSSTIAYVFHQFAYGDVSPALTFVFFAFFILTGYYWLTGNATATMAIHTWWNVAPILFMAITMGVH